MANSGKTVDGKLARLEVLATAGGSKETLGELATFIGDRNNRVVARASKMAADWLCYDVCDALVEAFRRFSGDTGAKQDKNCIAKNAVIRALYQLDFLEAEFYLVCIGYRQLEPVWGGSSDSAVDIRCTAAFGLAASSYPRAVMPLVTLLDDPEPAVRQSAVQAIALLEPFTAEATLRLKALCRDPDATVTGECLRVLLQLDGEMTAEFVAGFLAVDDAPEVREMAALALGEWQAEEAFGYLKTAWENNLADTEFALLLLRAMALQRHQKAIEFLLSIVAEEHSELASATVRALAIQAHNDTLRERVRAAVAQRSHEDLTAAFEDAWEI